MPSDLQIDQEIASEGRRGFFARYNLVILCAVTFLIPFMWLGADRALLSNKNDVKSWLPSTYQETATFEWYRKHFESDMFILVSWEGCTLDSPKLHLLWRRFELETQRPGSDPYKFFKSVISGAQIVDQLVETQGLTREQAIDRLRGFLVGQDGQQTCLVLVIDPTAEERWERYFHGNPRKKFLHAVVESVYQSAQEICDIKPAQLYLGGPPVDNVAIDVEGQKSLVRLAVVCGLVGAVMAWWCLRSWKLTLIVFSTGVYSAGLAMILVWLTGTDMNAILLTMPALVYVAAVSGAIHMANYYRDKVRTHIEWGLPDPTVGAPGKALKSAFLPLFLATFTTAFGLASLAVSELVPIQTFGIFSAAGIVVSFLFLCLYVPAMLQEWPIPQIARPRQTFAFDPGRWSGWKRVGDFIIARGGWVVAGCALLMVIGAIGASQIKTSVKLMKLFSPEATIIRDYAWLEEKLGPLVPMEIVIKVDRNQAKMDLLQQMKLVSEVQQAVKQLPDVGSVVAAPTFVRSVPSRPGIIEKRTWIVQLQRHRDELRDYWSQEGDYELWRVSARVKALTDLDYGDFVEDIRRQVEPVLAKYQAEGVSGISAVYTGLVPLVYKAQHSLLNGLLAGFAGDLVIIAIGLMFVMRDWSAGLLLGFASVFPIAIVFGAMGLLGIVVDVGTVMTPAVALGVTVDDAIHFMLWCRHGQERGMNRQDAIRFAYRDCAQAIYQSWGVIGLGLSAFALSSFTPTQRFGYLMFFMLTASSFGNLVLLPALLSSPLANFFWRSGEKLLEKKRNRQAVRPTRTEPELHPHLLPQLEPETAEELVPVHVGGQDSFEILSLGNATPAQREKGGPRKTGGISQGRSKKRLPRRPR